MSSYLINRNGEQFGPYSPEDLRAYINSGHILQTDLAWKEGMSSWLLVSQIYSSAVKNSAPPPMFTQANTTATGNSTNLSAPPTQNFAQPNTNLAQSEIPLPPSLHWGLVLLFTTLTLGIFAGIWEFIQNNWIKRIAPETASSRTLYFVGYVALWIAGIILKATDHLTLYWISLAIAFPLFWLWIFSAANAMRHYYNEVEQIGLKLSGPMIFFFNVFYLQHHMTRIANWKKTGYLSPQ